MQEKHVHAEGEGAIETPVRLVCMSLQKGLTKPQTTEYNFTNYSKAMESTILLGFNIV